MTPQQLIEQNGITIQHTHFRRLIADIEEYANQQTAPLLKRIEELEAWKESAMNVMPDYQEIGKLLNVKPGESVHDKIVPGIGGLVGRVKELEDGLRELYSAWYGHTHLMYPEQREAFDKAKQLLKP